MNPSPKSSHHPLKKISGLSVRLLSSFADFQILRFVNLGLLYIVRAQSERDFIGPKLFWLIVIGYYIGSLFFKGQTLGKVFFGLKIVDAGGQEVSYPKLVLRHVLLILFWLVIPDYVVEIFFWGPALWLILFLIHLMIPLIDRHHRYIHDSLSGTKVIPALKAS